MERILIVSALFYIAACTQSTPKIDSDAEFAAINAVETAQMDAFKAHDVAGAVAPYAPDAVFAATGFAPAATPEAIRTIFQSIIDDPNSDLTITQQRAELAASGDMAYTVASYTFTISDPASQQPVSSTGTNVTVWKKEPDKSWRIVADYNLETPSE